MKQFLKLFVCASLLFVAQRATAECCDSNANGTTNGSCDSCYCSSYYLPRSAGDDLVRQATYRNYMYGSDCFRGNMDIQYRHQGSRKGSNIQNALFGGPIQFLGSNNLPATTTTTNTNTGCSSSCNSNPTVVIADNFGLSPATNQIISFNPKISNDIVDFQLYLGLDELCNGLFFQLNLPVAHTRWKLNPCGSSNSTTTTNTNTGCSTSCNTSCNSSCGTNLPTPPTTPFNPGCVTSIYANYANTGVIPTNATVTAPATSFADALGGNFLFGDMQTAWTAGRFNFCDQSRTDLASVNLILGYNFYECPDYNLGVFLRAAAPMRSQDKCCATSYLFSPKVGDNYWKFGAGLTGHAELYNCNDEHFINVYLEGYAEHMFSRCQVRSFDFAGKGCLSRYMLLKEFNPTTKAYSQNIINGINFATRSINASIAVQGEGILEFVYNNDCGFSAGLGYNIYGHSREKGCNIGNPCDATLNNRSFGFKGCAPVQAAGYAIPNAGAGVCSPNITPTNAPVAYTLNSTQSAAKISACGANDNIAFDPTGTGATAGQVGLINYVCGGTALGTIYVNTCANNVNNLTTGTITVASLLAAGNGSGLAQESSSTQVVVAASVGSVAGAISDTTADPVIIDPTAAGVFNAQSGLAGSQITNKIFGHIDYAWNDCEWSPEVYLGGEVEFASSSRCAGTSFWAVYLGGGVSF